jgi:hypothetical protein
VLSDFEFPPIRRVNQQQDGRPECRAAM